MDGNGNFSLTGSCLYYVHYCAGCIYFLVCLLCKSHRTPPPTHQQARLLWFLFPSLVQKALASDICRDGQLQPFCLFSLSLSIVGYVKLDGKRKGWGRERAFASRSIPNRYDVHFWFPLLIPSGCVWLACAGKKKAAPGSHPIKHLSLILVEREIHRF